MRKLQVIDGDVQVNGKIDALGGVSDKATAAAVKKLESAVSAASIASKTLEVATATLSAEQALASVKLLLSTSSVTVSRAGVYFPSILTVSAKNVDDSSYYGRFIIATSEDASSWTDRYTSSADEQNYEYTFTTGVYVRVRLYEAGGVGNLLREAILTVTEDVTATPIYWGALTSAPSANYKEDDYYFDANTVALGGGVIRYYDGDSWEEMTSSHALYKTANWNALADMCEWATDQATVIAASTAIIQKLVTSDAFIENLYAQNITVPSGGSQRWYDGQGVNRTSIRIKDGRLDFLDSPDTTPATDEVLRARFGRLGVGEKIIMDGDFEAPITMPWGDSSVINATDCYYPAYIETDDGILRIAYRRTSDNYLVERIWSGSAWGTESVINAAGSAYSGYIQLSDGQLRIEYVRTSDDYLIERIWSGTAWGSESIVNAAESAECAYVQTIDGTLRSSYRRISDNYIVERIWSGSAWGAESVINNSAAYGPSYIQDQLGQLRISYSKVTSLVERIWSGTSWGAESVVNSASSQSPTYILNVDDVLRILYTRDSDNYIVERIWSGTAWGSESIVNAESSSVPACIQLRDGSARVAYINYSNYYLYERTLIRYAQIGAGIIASGGDATSGYWEKHGNGKLVQWGIPSIANGATVTFPTAFIAIPQFCEIHINNDSSNPLVSQCYSITATSFGANLRFADGTACPTVSTAWLAIGRWK